jgi:2-keto-4-pentenoate hydratase/2-oxohepta-3-ene-1,7-dioic acid hydratase in catechol pathway
VKFVTYRLSDSRSTPGVIEGDAVRAISTPTLRDYLELAPHERIAWHAADEPILLKDVRLEAPVVPSRNVFCVGRNYLAHAQEGARALGRELSLPKVPTFFTKAPTSIAAPGATLHLQADASSEYDYEAELAVVIGTVCKNVAETDAHAAIFGYTALNDVTARDLQREHGQWFKGKSLDDSCPMGPWIVTADEIGDAQALRIRLSRNGEPKQDATTADMIFPISRLIAELSKGMTLLPGDVIATGTPEGVGFARTPPEFLANGDVLRIEIERIGALENTIAIG